MTRKILALTAALLLMTGLTGTAAAGGTLSVVQETALVLPYEDYFEGVIYAEVKNTGDKPVQFSSGLFELFDAEGNSIGSREMAYYDSNPEVLLPGETGFAYAKIEMEGVKLQSDVADYALSLSGTGSITTSVDRYPASAFYQEGEGEFASRRYVAAIVENQSEETLRDFYAGIALKDAQGKLLYVNSGTWASSGIPAHQSMEIRLQVDENVVNYWESEGIVPAAAEAVVFKTAPK